MEWSEQTIQALETGWLEVPYSSPPPTVENEWWDACTEENRPFIVFRGSRKYGFAYFDMYTCRPGMRNKLTGEGMNKIEELHKTYLASLSPQARKLLADAGKRRLPATAKQSTASVYGPAIGEVLIRREDQHSFMPRLAAIVLDEHCWHSERVTGLGPIPGRRTRASGRGGKSSTNR